MPNLLALSFEGAQEGVSCTVCHSITEVNTPPTPPVSSRMGLNDYVKYASSLKPLRLKMSSWSCDHVVSPRSMTASNIGRKCSR